MLPLLRTAALRRGSTLVARARTAMPIPRRNYGSEVHPENSSSEMPWIIGSVAFTVPAVIYLMSGNSNPPDHSGKQSSQPVTHDPQSTVSKTVESAKQSLSDATPKASEKASAVAMFTPAYVAELIREAALETNSTATPKGDVRDETKETVEATGETVEQAKENTGEKVEEAKETISELTDKAKQTTAETTETAKEKASGLGENAREATHTLSEMAKATMEDIKDKAPGAEKMPHTAAERAILEENRKPYTQSGKQ